MSSDRRRYRIAAIVSAVATAGLLAGCSAGSPTAASSDPASSSATASTAPASSSNTRTYTQADVASILKSVNSTLALGGTVTTKVGTDTGAVDALDSYLANGNVKITPASCTDLIKSDEQVVSKLGASAAIAGTLTSQKLNLIVTTVAGGTLPTSLTSGFAASQRSVLSDCKHLTIAISLAGKAVTVTVDFAPIAVTTAADQSVGFSESIGIPGGASIKRATLEAIDGNLLIFASGVTASDEATLEKAVDATVSAAAK